MANNARKSITSTEELKIIQSSLIIPLVLAIIFSSIDIAVSFAFSLINYDNIYDIVLWGVRTVISYIFPSIFATIATMAWQSIVISVRSGIKENMIGRLIILIFLYIFFYILYIIFINTYYSIFFLVINVFVVVIFVKKFLDVDLLDFKYNKENSTEIQDNIVNEVNN